MVFHSCRRASVFFVCFLYSNGMLFRRNVVETFTVDIGEAFFKQLLKSSRRRIWGVAEILNVLNVIL